MSWFGSLSLAFQYAIAFGSLLFATLMVGALKMSWDRRKLKKHTKPPDLEAAGIMEQRHMNKREPEEGDLFGVRAIERGYYGGVSQSSHVSRDYSLASSRASFNANATVNELPKSREATTRPAMSSVPNHGTDILQILQLHMPRPVEDRPIVPIGSHCESVALAVSAVKSNHSGVGVTRDPAINGNVEVPPPPAFTRPLESTRSDSDSESTLPPCPLRMNLLHSLDPSSTLAMPPPSFCLGTPKCTSAPCYRLQPGASCHIRTLQGLAGMIHSRAASIADGGDELDVSLLPQIGDSSSTLAPAKAPQAPEHSAPPSSVNSLLFPEADTPICKKSLDQS